MNKKEWHWMSDYKQQKQTKMKTQLEWPKVWPKNNQTTIKKTMETPEIKKTTNYDVFKIHTANRKINKNHVDNIKKSMKKNFLLTPIIVNEKYEVIDGQHRLQACKDLGLPVFYYVKNNYSIKEMQRLNAFNKNWTSNNYLDTGVALNDQDYIDYKRFKNKYDFSHDINITLLCDNTTHKDHEKFREGTFKVKNYELACKYADKIYLILPYYEGFKRRRFVSAILFLIKHKKEVFSINEFISKLKNRPNSLQHCINTKQYLELIEEIYNYRRKLKVNLRF
tara:strand:+ start:386 stop:1225 length:840 start_codon:yes stop_codon:yes gene_type:complete